MHDKKLFNIELYYSPKKNFNKDFLILTGDEYYHASKVMRHKISDEIYLTDGDGLIVKGVITKANKEKFIIHIQDKFNYKNRKANITFCIPKLKSPDRFKFALEKAVELGVTNFIIYTAERSISKGGKVERWEKILLSAMKQSLRAHLPKIEVVETLKHIVELQGKKILFDQSAEREFSFNLNETESYYFVFGPEGGLTTDELNLFDPDSVFLLSDHRLRTETAIVKVASLL